MIRWLLLLLGGALLGGVMHLATVIILPRTATQDAYARLTPSAPVNTVVALPIPSPEEAIMPLMDPPVLTSMNGYVPLKNRSPRCSTLPLAKRM